jgi:hypothetical protein
MSACFIAAMMGNELDGVVEPNLMVDLRMRSLQRKENNLAKLKLL